MNECQNLESGRFGAITQSRWSIKRVCTESSAGFVIKKKKINDSSWTALDGWTDVFRHAKK